MFPSVTSEVQFEANDIDIPFSGEWTNPRTPERRQSKITRRRALAPLFFCSYFEIQKIEPKGVSGCVWVSVGRRAGACAASAAEIGFTEFRNSVFFEVVLSGPLELDTDVILWSVFFDSVPNWKRLIRYVLFNFTLLSIIAPRVANIPCIIKLYN